MYLLFFQYWPPQNQQNKPRSNWFEAILCGEDLANSRPATPRYTRRFSNKGLESFHGVFLIGLGAHTAEYGNRGIRHNFRGRPYFPLGSVEYPVFANCLCRRFNVGASVQLRKGC